ncbi:MAG TPA: hypothetical protein VGF56_14715 [Rhizomicrobium sp.]|jgi:hypothetical protein
MTHWLDIVIELIKADTADLRALAKLAGADPRTFYVGTRLDGADIRSQDLRGMLFTELGSAAVQLDNHTKLDAMADLELEAEEIDIEVQRIATYPRQEDRIGLLVNGVLGSPEYAIRYLTSYKPRSKLEVEVKGFLIFRIFNLSNEDSQNELLPGAQATDELALNRIVEIAARDAVQYVLRRTFPTRRGLQFLAFAEHLAHHRIIRNTLIARLAKTRSTAVEPLRTQITSILFDAARVDEE